MRSTHSEKRTLEALTENIPNVLALIVASVASVWLLLKPEAATEHLNIAFSALSVVLTLICANQVVFAIRSAGEPTAVGDVSNRFVAVEESLEQLRKRSDHVIGALKDIGKLVKCPTNNPNVYVELFGGFARTFCAYNPAYSIETSPILSDSEMILIKQVYVPRYKMVDNCVARYLFFTGDESGKKSLARFKMLMIKVASSGCPNVAKSLHVKQIKTKAAESHDEIYFGIQHGRPTVVHELSAPSETYGRPSYYYVSESPEFKSQCDKSFDDEWNSSDAEYVHDPSNPAAFFTPLP